MTAEDMIQYKRSIYIIKHDLWIIYKTQGLVLRRLTSLFRLTGAKIPVFYSSAFCFRQSREDAAKKFFWLRKTSKSRLQRIADQFSHVFYDTKCIPQNNFCFIKLDNLPRFKSRTKCGLKPMAVEAYVSVTFTRDIVCSCWCYWSFLLGLCNLSE